GSGLAARIVPRPAWRSSTTGLAPKRVAKSSSPSWTCGNRSATSRRTKRRKPQFYSTSSMSCAISARRSIRCARLNTRASTARIGASSRARSTICYHGTKTSPWRRSLKILLAANKRLNTAYILKEAFGQLWDYGREGWARRFFENWRASLKWQRLGPYERFADMIDRHWDGIAAYCKPENEVSLGFVEGLNNKIRVFQRRAYGLRDEEYLRLKVLTCMLLTL